MHAGCDHDALPLVMGDQIALDAPETRRDAAFSVHRRMRRACFVTLMTILQGLTWLLSEGSVVEDWLSRDLAAEARGFALKQRYWSAETALLD